MCDILPFYRRCDVPYDTNGKVVIRKGQLWVGRQPGELWRIEDIRVLLDPSAEKVVARQWIMKRIDSDDKPHRFSEKTLRSCMREFYSKQEVPDAVKLARLNFPQRIIRFLKLDQDP